MFSDYDVFLSYSHKDAQTPAVALVRLLEANGLRVRSDESLAPGEPISNAFERAMAESRVIIILLSPAAAESQWMRREVAYALRRQTSVILVVLNRAALDSPLGSLLGDRAFIDVSGMSADTVAREVLAVLNKRNLMSPSRKLFREAAALLRSSKILRYGFYAWVAVMLLFSTLLIVQRVIPLIWDYELAGQRLATRIRAGKIGQNLRGVDLAKTDLAGINLEGVDLSKANLSGAELSSAAMSNGRFDGARLTEARLHGIVARSASFVGASLLAADLRKADLRGANLSRADLRSADLRDTELVGSDLEGANLEGANLEGANLEGAVFNKSTRWSKDFDAQKRGANCRDCSVGHEH